MKEEGIVLSVNGNKTKVRVTSTAECTGCPSKHHCHFGENGSREITVINEYGAKVSDHVVFESDTGKVIFSAVLIWIVPLLSMFAGYIVGTQFSSGFLPIATAFGFLILTFIFLKFLDNTISGGKTFYPRITKILPSNNNLHSKGNIISHG
ncbi:MAG TPA: hypothetical protein ENH82_05135 [bacterium]|nr:hypothetical protein [bacterium]